MRWVGAAVASLAVLIAPAAAVSAVAISVNHTADVDDATDDRITLREAILIANGSRAPGVGELPLVTGGAPGSGIGETIGFVAPGFGSGMTTITASTDLPALTDDLTTLDGRSVVRILASGTLACGLRVTGDWVIVTGIEVTGFGTGICIEGATGAVVTLTTVDQSRGDGIRLDGAVGPIVDGCSVTGGGGVGIVIEGATTDASLTGNRIGLDAAGAVVGNAAAGIRIVGGIRTIVGGAGLGNEIRANGADGVHVVGGTGATIGPDNAIGANMGSGVLVAAPAGSTRIVSNRIGVGIAFQVLPNLLDGIHVDGAADVEVAGNDVRNNKGAAIRLRGGAMGARVGKTTEFAGNTLRGNGYGVAIEGGASGNVVGPENVVLGNGGDGVLVDGAATIKNRITINSISAHTRGKAIQLIGGNTMLKAPAVTSVTTGVVAGVAPLAAVSIELFNDPGAEAAVYIGPATSAAGSWTFTGTVPTTGNLTATATDAVGNTSELSAPYSIPAPLPPESGSDAGVDGALDAVADGTADESDDLPSDLTLGDTLSADDAFDPVVDGGAGVPEGGSAEAQDARTVDGHRGADRDPSLHDGLGCGCAVALHPHPPVDVILVMLAVAVEVARRRRRLGRSTRSAGD